MIQMRRNIESSRQKAEGRRQEAEGRRQSVTREAGVSVKPGVERSGTPGTRRRRISSPRSGPSISRGYICRDLSERGFDMSMKWQGSFVTTSVGKAEVPVSTYPRLL